ncbi:MAG: glycosyl transferase, partial [Firmicutes bacterium]|nr:glycosyl transferase [Bacillota bacterium]
KALGLPVSEPGPLEIPLGESSLAWAREWLAAKGAAPCLIAIHGAGKWLTQGWTAADFMTLVGAAEELRPHSKILITFGPGDTALQQAVESALAEKPNPAVLCPGQLPFSQWAALFSLCDVVISPDTGAVHLAVALGRPVVSLYEANVFLRASRQFAPWQVPAGVLRWESPQATIPLILGETLRLLPTSSRKDF